MAYKICLDAGHYGKYNRSKVVPEYYESEMNWKLHNYLAEELEQLGFAVIKTRENQEKDLGLTARGKKSAGCDLFLSIHSNAADAEYVDYPLVITMQDGKGDQLGLTIAGKIQQLMGTVQAGKIMKKKGTYGGEWYSVLEGARQVGVMGMIIEHSFHTNKKAACWLLEDRNLRAMAKAEAEIIGACFGMEKKHEEEKRYIVRLGTYTEKETQAVVQALTKLGYTPEVEAVCAPSVSVWTPAVGDVVLFEGNTQYTSSEAKAAKAAAAGLARITAFAEGKAHPYHLKRTGDSGPWGWVDAGSFRKGPA